MKMVLKNGNLSTNAVNSGLRSVRPGLSARPSPATRAAPARANPYKLSETNGKSSPLMWIVVAVVAVVIIGGILIAAAGRRPVNVQPVAQAQERHEEPMRKSPLSEAGKPDPRLGGLTWAEYSAKKERESAELKARKKRLNDYQSGAAEAAGRGVR